MKVQIETNLFNMSIVDNSWIKYANKDCIDCLFDTINDKIPIGINYNQNPKILESIKNKTTSNSNINGNSNTTI